MYSLLLYDYVEDIAERRVPHRPGHLELVQSYLERGELEMAGAFADPLDGALFLFTAGPEVAERFAAEDPYVANGLVTHWRVRGWNVVTAPPAERSRK